MADLDAKALARTHTQDAIDALVFIVNKKTSTSEARVLAARTLLELGYGLLNGEVDLVGMKVNAP